MAKKSKTAEINVDGQKRIKNDDGRELTVQEKKLLDYLNAEAEKDAQVAEDLKRDDKSFKDCMEYVSKRAWKEMENANMRIQTSQGRGGFFDDAQVVGWALHYYHEDKASLDKEFKKEVSRPKAPAQKAKKAETIKVDDTEILFDLF